MKQAEFRNLLDIATYFPTEESCHAYVAKMRGGNAPTCVHCGQGERLSEIC